MLLLSWVCRLFDLDKLQKKSLKTKGGRRRHLMLWGVGLQLGTIREQFHHVVGAAEDDIKWPAGELQEAVLQIVQQLQQVACGCLQILGGATLLAEWQTNVPSLPDSTGINCAPQVSAFGDPSVLDLFWCSDLACCGH